MSSTTADGPPDPEQTRRLVLDGSEGTVQRARDFSRRALLDWQWLPAAGAEQQAVAEDVLLMVSELVTNACLHAPGARASCGCTGTESACWWRWRTRARCHRGCTRTPIRGGRAGTVCGSWTGSPGPGDRCRRTAASSSGWRCRPR